MSNRSEKSTLDQIVRECRERLIPGSVGELLEQVAGSRLQSLIKKLERENQLGDGDMSEAEYKKADDEIRAVMKAAEHERPGITLRWIGVADYENSQSIARERAAFQVGVELGRMMAGGAR